MVVLSPGLTTTGVSQGLGVTQIANVIELLLTSISHSCGPDLKGCTHRVMIPCDWAVDSHRKQ